MATVLECAQFSQSVYAKGDTYNAQIWHQITDIPGLNPNGYSQVGWDHYPTVNPNPNHELILHLQDSLNQYHNNPLVTNL